MAIPKPGTLLGPCVGPCEHPGCNGLRRMAESICRYCGEAIGYDRRVNRDPDDIKYEGSEYNAVENKHFVHWSCLAKGS